MLMRFLTLFHNGNEIEIHNSLWNGKETIKYNGEVVSSKFSIGGEVHLFTVEEDGELVDYAVHLFLRGFGIGFNVARNGQPLLLS